MRYPSDNRGMYICTAEFANNNNNKLLSGDFFLIFGEERLILLSWDLMLVARDFYLPSPTYNNGFGQISKDGDQLFDDHFPLNNLLKSPLSPLYIKTTTAPPYWRRDELKVTLLHCSTTVFIWTLNQWWIKDSIKWDFAQKYIPIYNTSVSDIIFMNGEGRLTRPPITVFIYLIMTIYTFSLSTSLRT